MRARVMLFFTMTKTMKDRCLYSGGRARMAKNVDGKYNDVCGGGRENENIFCRLVLRLVSLINIIVKKNF